MNMAATAMIDDEARRQGSKRGPKRKYQPVEVIQLLADGTTIFLIAQKYGVMPGTIRVTIHNFMKQYKVNTTAQLVAHFLRNGWVD
jgi:DNA-binding NarL/FixJ family response regulator